MSYLIIALMYLSPYVLTRLCGKKRPSYRLWACYVESGYIRAPGICPVVVQFSCIWRLYDKPTMLFNGVTINSKISSGFTSKYYL